MREQGGLPLFPLTSLSQHCCAVTAWFLSLSGLQHSDMMGPFSWSHHGVYLKRVESGWRERWGREMGGLWGGGGKAEETPVWPYHWEQSAESSLASVSLIIWQGATDMRAKTQHSQPKTVMSVHIDKFRISSFISQSLVCVIKIRLTIQQQLNSKLQG